MGSVFPNPTTGGATLRFHLPAPGRVHVAILDVTGRMIRSLDRSMDAGPHAFTLELPGRRSRPGVYFLVMDLDGVRIGTRRLVVRR